MDEKGEWKLSPAYDLTFSNGPGENKAQWSWESLSKALIEESVAQTRLALGQWKSLAKEYGIGQSSMDLIGKRLAKNP